MWESAQLRPEKGAMGPMVNLKLSTKSKERGEPCVSSRYRPGKGERGGQPVPAHFIVSQCELLQLYNYPLASRSNPSIQT